MQKQVFSFLSLESVYSSALVIFGKVIISGSKDDKLYPFEEKLEVHLSLAKFEKFWPGSKASLYRFKL